MNSSSITDGLSTEYCVRRMEQPKTESQTSRKDGTMNQRIPDGMTRRHFMRHMAGASAWTIPALTLGRSLQLHAADLRQRHKSAILLWMSGGPSTIDIWDLKPGATTGGPFRPMSTSGDVQICEHMPQMAELMHHMTIVRSMSTSEADHGRGRYYMHTGYKPNPNIEHPSYGSVLSHELREGREELEIPPFVSVGGGSVGPGFLGMAWSPFTVTSGGRIRNLEMGIKDNRLADRMNMLYLIENNFDRQKRGSASQEHFKILEKTERLMTSPQMEAFKVRQEPQRVQDRYGTSGFGRGCLLARRLVEAGVPFVEVDFGGWDNHSGIFPALETKLATLDQGMSALISDLEQRGLLGDTAIIWMGEFGRTPRINGNAGRDHWARSWSVAVGGGDLQRGIAIGETNQDGTRVESEPYTSQDLMASICKALGISLETTFTSNEGRPMKIANSGKVITDLFG